MRAKEAESISPKLSFGAMRLIVDQLMIEVGVGWMEGMNKQVKVKEMTVDCRFRTGLKRGLDLI